MNALKSVSIFAIFGILLLLTSCKKDDKQDDRQELSGTYTFTTISGSNAAYGFKRENGTSVEIPEADIDLSIFDDCNQVHQVDDIQILSDATLSYTAYDIWTNNGGSRTEESTYSITDGILKFTHRDEFGNEDPIWMLIEGEVLILKMYAYVEVWNGSVQAIEVYDDNPNFGYSIENASNRLSSDEGDEIYVLLYEQRYQ